MIYEPNPPLSRTWYFFCTDLPHNNTCSYSVIINFNISLPVSLFFASVTHTSPNTYSLKHRSYISIVNIFESSKCASTKQGTNEYYLKETQCYIAVCNNYAICNKLQTALNCNAVCNTLQTAFRVKKKTDKTRYEINVQIKRSLK